MNNQLMAFFNHKAPISLWRSALLVLCTATLLSACLATSGPQVRGYVTQQGEQECDDGIDNDGDGYVDWQYDLGCWGSEDGSESSGTRVQENGWTTFDISPESRVIYVSASSGDDVNNGLSPEHAVASLKRGAALVRDGHPDFLLLKRGDVWYKQGLGRFKSGKNQVEPLVIASYGESIQRPRIEVDRYFLNDINRPKRYLAVLGLEIVALGKDPTQSAFDGKSGGGIRYVSGAHSGHLLFEDMHLQYAEFIIQNTVATELRRNTIYRSYRVGTCAFNEDGSPDFRGNRRYRPSGIFAGKNSELVLEGNFFYENGWNPDVENACATIYNHNVYLADNKHVVFRDNISLRPSSIGLKVTANRGEHSSDQLHIINNLFAEGEIGISIGGNKHSPHRFANTIIRDNVFTHIGRNPPTKRELSWYIDVIDNDHTLIENNLLLNSPAFSNTFGINLRGSSNRHVQIKNNYFYNIYRSGLRLRPRPLWNKIDVVGNTFLDRRTQGCLLQLSGDLSPFYFEANRYRSRAEPLTWFCLEGKTLGFEQWSMLAAENHGVVVDDELNQSRGGASLEQYAEQMGLESSIDALAHALLQQSRLYYRPALSAEAINKYFRTSLP